jgi:hypothetical protein
MPEITLTEEQTKKVVEFFGTVTVLDPKGMSWVDLILNGRRK